MTTPQGNFAAELSAIRPILHRARKDRIAERRRQYDGSFSGAYWTDPPAALTNSAVARHLNGGDAIGVSAITPGQSLTSLVLLDLDSHGGETPWSEMMSIGARVASALLDAGMPSTAFRSTGGRGLHLYVIWDTPQEAYDARRAVFDVLALQGFRPGDGGVSRGQIEVFPKQDWVRSGENGNMFIVPLAGKSVALDLVFGSEVSAADVQWVVAQPVPVLEKPEGFEPGVGVPPGGQGALAGRVSIGTVRSALAAIPNETRAIGPDYSQYRNIAFAVYDATGGSEDGFKAMLQFSLRNTEIVAEKGADGVEQFLRDRLWRYIKGDRGSKVTWASVIGLARGHGWSGGPLDLTGFVDQETGEIYADDGVSSLAGAGAGAGAGGAVGLVGTDGASDAALGGVILPPLMDVPPVDGRGTVGGAGSGTVGLGLVDPAEALRNAEKSARNVIDAMGDLLSLTTTVYPALREILGKFPALHKVLYELVSAKVKGLGSSVTKTEFAAAVKPAHTPTVKTKSPLTEFGNADRMIARYGEQIMYVPEIDQWYVWTGVYWRRAEGNECEIEHFAQQVVRDLVNEAEDFEHAAEFFQFCAASQRATMVKAMLTLIKGQGKVVVPFRMLDANPHLIGAKNGVVDLRTGALISPVDPKLYITMTVGCDYKPEAKAPLFEQTIRDVFFDNTEMVEYVMRAFGYAMMGNPIEDKMFIAFGNGANGKSTIFNAVREIFGDYARVAEASSFVSNDPKAGNAGGPREDIVRLRGSRFVYVNEPDEGGELREGTVKSMTGGDSITARTAYAKTSVEVRPTWVVFMPTNHKPIIKGSDNGIWRRMELIPFERNFTADKTISDDKQRRQKILNEREGILVLLVNAARRYQQIGLTSPATIRSARDQYRSDMDILDEWLNECCELDPEAKTAISVLWKSWESHAKDRGLLNYIRSSSALSRRLDTRFPAVRDGNGSRLRSGLRLKMDFASDVDPFQ